MIAMLAAEAGVDEVRVAWLGQAGFVMRMGGLRIVIDPYLSNSLAVKYAGKLFPHTRMMPAPIEPQALRDIDLVLCTHRHTDHMDPGTLPAIASNNPQCRFVIPAAESEHAWRIGVPRDRTFAVDAGVRLTVGASLQLHVVASAHEQMERDDEGRHRFLGFVMQTPTCTLYHSGDTIPYDGLADTLAPWGIDVALLPCNGRDAYRREHGVPGNMSLNEAIALCRTLRVPWLVPHHFGMFAFNTCDEQTLALAATAQTEAPRLVVPTVNHTMIFQPLPVSPC